VEAENDWNKGSNNGQWFANLVKLNMLCDSHSPMEGVDKAALTKSYPVQTGFIY